MLFSKKSLLVLGGASIVSLLIIFNSSLMLNTLSPYTIAYTDYNLTLEEPPIDPEQSCQIPRIHPFDSSILPYLQKTKPIYCKLRQQPLTYINSSGYLVFNYTLVKITSLPNCDYRYIERKSGDDTKLYYSEPRKLPPDGALMASDFVTVSCYNFAGIAYYTDYHAHISVPSQRKPHAPNDKYSVLLIGIDSLSRLAFIRQLPKTYSYLTNDMNSYVFRGMTKVGDNTFPNLVALLTGKSPFDGELPKVEGSEHFDSWPLVWKNFSKAGYSTLYAEDRPDIALFNYLRNGFSKQPTDHYMRPYWLAVESSSAHRFSSNLCFGSTPKHLLQLRYAEDFARRYNGTPYFGFVFFVEISHDYVSQVSVADDDLASWLQNLHSQGYLNDTFLIFFSDHGHRFDTIRSTLVGRIEERMPFFSMYVPPKVIETNPNLAEVLRINTGRLTSPYDTYYTLLDVLKLKKSNSLPLGSVEADYASSLFRAISPKRTCAQAKISEHYCTCEVETPLPLSDKRCTYSADLVIDTLNRMILEKYLNYSLCTKLSLKKIHRCDQSLPNRKVIVNSRIYFGTLKEDGQAIGITSKIRVVVEAEPSGGLFEASSMYNQDDGTLYGTSDISRINRYGNQSSCISDAVLRKYCYCNKY